MLGFYTAATDQQTAKNLVAAFALQLLRPQCCASAIIPRSLK